MRHTEREYPECKSYEYVTLRCKTEQLRIGIDRLTNTNDQDKTHVFEPPNKSDYDSRNGNLPCLRQNDKSHFFK